MSSPGLQFCGEGRPSEEDDSEVFFGDVTERERRKASKYSRRTVAFQPDFRGDRNLMRYTMDQLQMLSLAAENRDERHKKFGSEGTDSCESQSPLGSTGCDSRDQSPLEVDSGTDSLPVLSREQLYAWVRRSGIHEIIDKLGDDNSVESPMERRDSPYSDSPRSRVFEDSAICSPDPVLDCQMNGVSVNNVEGNAGSCEAPEDSRDERLASEDLFDSLNETGIKYDLNDEEYAQYEDLISDTPQKFPKLTTALNSPLVNTASSGTTAASPPVIMGDINSLYNGNVQYCNVFARNTQQTSPHRTSLFPSGISVDPVGTQEVPNSVSNSESHSREILPDLREYCDNSGPIPSLLASRISTVSDKSLVFDPNDSEDDISILTMGSVMEESIMDCSRRTFRFSEGGESHVVPDVESNGRARFLRSRPGVVFTEKQFSPTLTVRTSPPRDHDDERPQQCGNVSPRRLNVKNLFLDLTDCDEDLASTSIPEGLVPESPECLSEVMVQITVATPPSSPKKAKVKRLSPVKSPKASHEDSKVTGSVYNRLYGLKQTPEDSSRPSVRPSSAKSAPATNKAESLRRAHSASKLATAHKTHTPFHTSGFTMGSARRGLAFPSHKTPTSIEKKAKMDPRCTPCGIKTTGRIDRQALCQATAATKVSSGKKLKPSRTTPKSGSRVTTATSKVTPCKANPVKVTPGKVTASKVTPAKVTPAKVTLAKVEITPSGPPGCVTSASDRKLHTPPPVVYKHGTPRFPKDAACSDRPQASLDPVPSLEFHDSVNECDLSVLDNSILLQEKKVELERLHLEKIRLQKQKNKQKPECRSPLIPTTADNLPKVRFTDKRALSLSEPELDAITLVHTLCNSQQVAKLVTKPRASQVVRHTNTPMKPASKLQWNETLATEIANNQDDLRSRDSSEEPAQARRRSILTTRTPGNHFPYYDQPQSPIVVTKGNRKFTGFGKEPSNLV